MLLRSPDPLSLYERVWLRQTSTRRSFRRSGRRLQKGGQTLLMTSEPTQTKPYPSLQDEARERLSLNAYLAKLPQPQIAFSVHQKQPSTLDDTVAATLEMESYIPPSSINSTLSSEDEPAPISMESIDQVTQLTRVVERLVNQVDKLQRGVRM